MADQPNFDDRDGWIWMDGKLVPWREAEVHVLTHAMHYASSVFEGQRAYDGKIFKLSEHSARLRKSGELLGFELPWSVEEIDAACIRCSKRRHDQCLYAPLAWPGSEQMGVSGQGANPHLAIAAWSWEQIFRSVARGARHSPTIALAGVRRPTHRRFIPNGGALP